VAVFARDAVIVPPKLIETLEEYQEVQKEYPPVGGITWDKFSMLGEYVPQEVKAGQLYTLIHQQESENECYITIIPADGVSFKSIKVNSTDVVANEQEKITYDLLGYITVKVTVKQDDAEIEQTATYKLKEKKKSPQKN
jgi:hypothetical protein